MASVPSTALQIQTAPQEFCPAPPQNLAATELSGALVERLVMNIINARSELKGKEISDTLGLRFSVIDGILDDLRARQLLEVKGSLGYGSVAHNFVMTDMGRKRYAADPGATRYCGPAPVPARQYREALLNQKPQKGWLTRELLSYAYRHMEVTPEILGQIGPAVGSGKSLLIYGQPGNGKTYLAEALAEVSGATIFIPYAIEFNGMIIRIFDPLLHKRVHEEPAAKELFSAESSFDARWVRCRRPFIVSGGELSLDMLEISFDPETKAMEAPLHMKGNNGFYLIDDFGRQKVSPAELLNRWIVPLESHVDQLRLPFGGTMTMPFEVQLIFSTNLNPSDLGDEAFLRRIQYKVLVADPSKSEFCRIFHSLCRSKNLACEPELLNGFIERYYPSNGRPFRRCHPRDLVSHALDIIEFEGRPYQLNDELLDMAYASCFVSSSFA